MRSMGGEGAKPVGLRLAEAFLGALASRVALEAPPSAEAEASLDEELAARIAAAAATWPVVRVEPERFAAYLGARSAAADSLGSMCVDDLYLACACAAVSPEALRAFDRCYLDRIDGFVRRFDGSPAFLDEVRQILRRKLFLAEPGKHPKIEDYSGRGALSSWVGVAAQRVAVSLLRGRRPEVNAPDEILEGEISQEADPELEYVRTRYRSEFRAALGEALASLPDEERTLLRLYYVGGLSLPKLAQLKHVSFATVSRRLARTRRAIAAHMKKTLERTLKLSPAEFTSLARLVRSSLEASLFRMLHEVGAA